MVPTIEGGDPEPSEARRGEENSARVSAPSCENRAAKRRDNYLNASLTTPPFVAWFKHSRYSVSVRPTLSKRK